MLITIKGTMTVRMEDKRKTCFSIYVGKLMQARINFYQYENTK